jgi:Acyl-CoA dehydrogenase, C-terminal domain
VDLTLDPTQRQISDSIERIIEQNGGWRRALVLVEQGAYDYRLHETLEAGGFWGLATGTATGAVEAAMAVELLARGSALVSAGASALVLPCVTSEAAQGPVAMVSKPGVPVRLLPFAKTALVLLGDEAGLLELRAGDVEPAKSDQIGWPLGRLTDEAIARSSRLGLGTGAVLSNWWRVALAAEAAGIMRGALALTVSYVKDRIQFGRPIGSFQTIQHRLAQLTVLVEGVYWLAMEAAFKNAEPFAAAVAATHAARTAPLIFAETHQMHGAMGFTREYPLHLWSMRLPALQRELGGLKGHARAAAAGLIARSGSHLRGERTNESR